MSQKNNTGSVVIAATSFLGGLAVGLLLRQRKKSGISAWLDRHAAELSEWADHQKKSVAYSTGDKIRRMRKHVNTGIFPDLYEATEHIALSDRDILDG